MPKLALTACCCCKHIKGTVWETLAPQACPDLAVCPFLQGGGVQRGVCDTKSDISDGCRHRVRLAAGGTGARSSTTPEPCLGWVQKPLCRVGSSVGWSTGQGVQSCTWSSSFTWAVVALGPVLCSGAGRGWLLQLPMGVGKHTRPRKFTGPCRL